MATRRNIQYSRLPMEDIDGDHVREKANDNLRFIYTPKLHMRIPWKSIALALFLLLIGISLLSLSYFIFTNHMEGDGSQAYSLLFLGVLAFLPGYYETRVAYRSTRVQFCIHPGLIAICVSSIESMKWQLGQAPGQLIVPLMDLSKLSRPPSDTQRQHIL